MKSTTSNPGTKRYRFVAFDQNRFVPGSAVPGTLHRSRYNLHEVAAQAGRVCSDPCCGTPNPRVLMLGERAPFLGR